MGLLDAIKKRRAKLILLFASVLLPLMAVEIYLHVVDRYRPPPHPVTPQDPDVYCQYPWGYGLRPDALLKETFEDGPTFLHPSNRHGFRAKRQVDEADSRRRIVVAGDSFVFGWGVEKEERFTDVIEAARPEWRLENIGMNGYGTDLTFRAVEQVGLLAKPEVVIFSIYSDAFPRVRPHFVGMGYEVPRYEWDGTRLRSVAYPKHRPWDGLRTSWFVRNALWQRSGLERTINEAVLKRFFALARERGFRPVVLFFAGWWPESGKDRGRLEFLKGLCEDHGVELIDVSEVRELGRRRTYIGIHWNARGHAWVADRVVEALEPLLR